ncbi:MAG: hypothetical protein WBG53_03170 [Rhodococcus sp. (in: high G+C Gram-positive bacteria)]|uniref:hypothetical protein n=1 Tax=unclassified Rhodococcus (in: high G+C Gram-positive bacteria) TaxID=192944 RepID=UPI000A470241|nr:MULTISPECIES: hypothetical protein [unclassified Rhodococcus (in: high G+C Gram-positive bacteria)]RMB77912.1 hypothetical protein AYK61_17085 [Rhodococcus sp. SBT000017]
MLAGRREALRRRYLSLGLGELAAAAVFLAVALTMAIPRLDDQQDRLALWSALVPLLIVLVQAGIYWLLARSWVEHHPMPVFLRGVYRVCRIVDVALLAGGLVGIVVWFPAGIGAALAVVAVWLLGVIEFVNYFVVRLSYPARSWFSTVRQLRTPRLVRDMTTVA